MAVVYSGRSYDVDPEGYLVDPRVWSHDLAVHLAKLEELELSTQHWEVINFVRSYHEEFGIAPAIRVLTKAIGKKLGPEKGNTIYLYTLFPKGPAMQACKIAGLPKPTGCIEVAGRVVAPGRGCDVCRT